MKTSNHSLHPCLSLHPALTFPEGFLIFFFLSECIFKDCLEESTAPSHLLGVKELPLLQSRKKEHSLVKLPSRPLQIIYKPGFTHQTPTVLPHKLFFFQKLQKLLLCFCNHTRGLCAIPWSGAAIWWPSTSSAGRAPRLKSI